MSEVSGVRRRTVRPPVVVSGWVVAIVLFLEAVAPFGASADEHGFPEDFPQPSQVIGGAGGGTHRSPDRIHRLPVIMVADTGRVHRDWLGANCGETPGNVYGALLQHGFRPDELWMLNLVAGEGDRVGSLELRTDNVKAMILAVLEYTGAPAVAILAHGVGGVVVHAALVKYNLFRFVRSVAYVASPLHGTDACRPGMCIRGFPVCCSLTPGSDFLWDTLLPDETPLSQGRSEDDDRSATRYTTVRNGRRFGDAWFRRHPDSPALLGATNLSFPELDHDGLRCSPVVVDRLISVLTVEVSPYDPAQDMDGDGFEGVAWGGPDCDDRRSEIHPGAADGCDDGIDQDCNGVDISCRPGKDRDIPPERLPETGAVRHRDRVENGS